MTAMANRTAALIKKKLEAAPRGSLFTSRAFLKYGTRAAVDHALSRFAKTGVVTRVARGIYARPKANRTIDRPAPAAEAVARVVARQSGEKLQLGGAEAAARLELTTQQPANSVFETRGTPRRIRMGKLEIRLKQVAPRRAALAGRPAGDALAALWYLGKHRVTNEIVGRIRQKLPSREYQALKNEVPFQAAWMAEVFRKHERSIGRVMARKSHAAAHAEAAERERIRRMSAQERALLALDLGERLDALKRLRP
jgi:hypothetical protein